MANCNPVKSWSNMMPVLWLRDVEQPPDHWGRHRRPTLHM
jgi:hypothetical protein